MTQPAPATEFTATAGENPHLPEIGAELGGGFVGAILRDAEAAPYALIVAPKAKGEAEDLTWQQAQDFCAGLSIGGQNDWRLPSMDEFTALRANCMPESYVQWPPKTNVECFKAGGAQAFETEWYWSGTQASANGAWCQGFFNGDQHCSLKSNLLRARAVRKYSL